MLVQQAAEYLSSESAVMGFVIGGLHKAYPFLALS